METAIATILGALIAAAASITVCVINNNKQNTLIAYRLQELEKKVEKHNNLVERTYQLEEDSALQEERIRVANKRIADLEKIAGGSKE